MPIRMSDRLDPLGGTPFVIGGERALDGEGGPASQFRRIVDAVWAHPQKAITASPMNLSIVPPSCSTQAATSERC